MTYRARIFPPTNAVNLCWATQAWIGSWVSVWRVSPWTPRGTAYILNTSDQPWLGESSSSFSSLYPSQCSFFVGCSQDCSEEVAMANREGPAPWAGFMKTEHSLDLSKTCSSHLSSTVVILSLLTFSEGCMGQYTWEHATEQICDLRLWMLLFFCGFPSLDLAPVAPNTRSQIYLVSADNLSSKLFVDIFIVTLLNELVLVIYVCLLLNSEIFKNKVQS